MTKSWTKKVTIRVKTSDGYIHIATGINIIDEKKKKFNRSEDPGATVLDKVPDIPDEN